MASSTCLLPYLLTRKQDTADALHVLGADGFPHGFKRGVQSSQEARGLLGDDTLDKPENAEFMITVVADVMMTVEALGRIPDNRTRATI